MLSDDIDIYDILYAYDCAAEFLDNEECPDDRGKQEKANKEVARRIRATANQINLKLANELALKKFTEICHRNM